MVLVTLMAFPRKNNDRVCGRFCDGICFKFKAVTKYVSSKVWGLSYKWQWRSLVSKSFLVKLFRPLLWMVMTEAVENSVTGSVFNLRLWRSLFLVKLRAFYYKWHWQSLWWSLFLKKFEVFPITMKAYYKWPWRSLCRSLLLVELQAFARNVSNRACDWINFS